MTITTPAFVGRPDPPVTPDTRAWWDATRRRQLTVQRCDACGHAQLYPRVLCTACGALELHLEPVSGRAVVHSHSTVATSPNPALFVPPYVVALVVLAEGPTMLTDIVGPRAGAVRCDDPVHVVWEALPDGRHLPLFAPIEQDLD